MSTSEMRAKTLDSIHRARERALEARDAAKTKKDRNIAELDVRSYTDLLESFVRLRTFAGC